MMDQSNDGTHESAGASSLEQIMQDAEDYVFPQIEASAWERALYYHLLRRTLSAGQKDALVGIDPLGASIGFSGHKVRELVRTMHTKGCVTIVERTRKGHLIRLNLPREIPGIQFGDVAVEAEVDWETTDVYTGRKFVAAILQREGHACFYCLRDLTFESAVLDHAVPLYKGGSSTFRNVVASCHECNSLKRSEGADDFLRLVYRKGIINERELQDGLARLEKLFAGELPLTHSRFTQT